MIVAMLIAALAIVPSDAAAQQSLTLKYEEVLVRPMPGATAAFSLDPSRVGASVRDGLLTLIGRGPGATNVIVIAADETNTLRVLVEDPPTIVLPGMRQASSRGGTGYVEARYGSDPGVVQGSLFVARQDGDRSAELTLGGAAPLGGDIGSPFSFPQASFTIRTPHRELTLLDRVIANSPLTIARSNVRGLHLREGPWQVHAGYSFFSTFEHLLLPTAREGVAGVGYRQRLGRRSSLTPNLYYFSGRAERGGGPLGTLLYETRTSSGVTLAAEIGASRAVGGAFEMEIDRPNNRAWARVRVAPSELPSLTTDQPSGRQAEGGWVWQGGQSSVNANVSARSYELGASGYSSRVGSVDLRRQLTQRWSVHGGTGLSSFDSVAEPVSRMNTLTLPLGTSFAARNVGFGVDYQYGRETARDLGGHLVRATLNGSARGIRLSTFGERQTQAPTVGHIFAEAPWLQPMLDRLGLAAGTPQQLANLLRTNAELSAYGYANTIRLDLTPVRTRLGASGSWSGTGARRPQLTVNTFINRDAGVERTSLGAVHSATFSQRLSPGTEFFVTWSAVCHERVASSSSCRPVLFASLRRSLNAAPGLLMERRGHIEGIVFKDDRAEGIYTPGLPPLAGIEVVLDGVRRTRTDDAGRFRFDDVPYGRHRVEARQTSQEAAYFTTPSPVDVDTGSSVAFGIALSRSSLRGVVLTDAGIGVPGVLIHIAGGDRSTTVRTADDGTFVGEGLIPGDYDVAVDAGSVPAGYPVDGLARQRVRVEQTTPGRAAFMLRPYRTVAGRARLFDRETGRYIALAGGRVELQPLAREAVTDGNGQYAFRDVPPGDYRVVATHGAGEYAAAVHVPAGPALVRNVDIAVVSAPPLAAGAGTMRARGAARPDAPQVATRGPFTIQIAESPSARHARAMVDELKASGHDAYVVGAGGGSKGPYLVRAGHYPTLEEATRSARELEKKLGWEMSVAAVLPQLAARGSGAGDVR